MPTLSTKKQRFKEERWARHTGAPVWPTLRNHPHPCRVGIAENGSSRRILSRGDWLSRLRRIGGDSAFAATEHGDLPSLPARSRKDSGPEHHRGARLLARHVSPALSEQSAAA